MTRAVQDALGQPGITVPPPAEELLKLPVIADEILRIDSAGVKTALDYAEAFSSGYESIEFDNLRFANLALNASSGPLLPNELVQKVLDGARSPEIKNSLLIYRDFMEARKEFARSISVFGDGATTNKLVISLNDLTIELIDKAIATIEGRISVQELTLFFARFRTTSLFENEKFLDQLNVLSYDSTGIFQKLAEFLGVPKRAFAQLPGFGGAITLPPGGPIYGWPPFCICSANFWFGITLPTPPPVSDSLVMPLSMVFPPFFYPFESMRIGAIWLGNYSFAKPCVQLIFATPPFCTVIGTGSLFSIAGTSI
ncbi:MAG: hypothetical protein AAB897_03590 [Patescibacteria group bacterium]